MKKQTLLFMSGLLALAMGSCVNQDEITETPDENGIVINKDFLMTQAFDVPLQSDLVTVVILEGDTLAITDVPLTVNVPSDISTELTRADDGSWEASDALQLFYVNYADLPTFTPGSFIHEEGSLLFFEDSFHADYDYNDLVLYLKAKIYGGYFSCTDVKIEVNVRGIALGGIKHIGFGFTDIKGRDYILSDDVRKDYFSGQDGMLNTTKGVAHVPGIEEGEKPNEKRDNHTIIYKKQRHWLGDEFKGGYIKYDEIRIPDTSPWFDGCKYNEVTYFIIVDDNVKLYIASVNAKLNNTLPYGLQIATTCGDFHYPIEKKYVGEAFPNFEGWLKDTKNNKAWHKNPVEEHCIKHNVKDHKIY